MIRGYSGSITLPLPPSLNVSYITKKNSLKRIMTTECRLYKESVWLYVKSRIKKPYKTIECIEYRFYWPNNRRVDADNRIKVLRDCLKNALFEDDCWQCLKQERIVNNGIDRINPRVIVSWV